MIIPVLLLSYSLFNTVQSLRWISSGRGNNNNLTISLRLSKNNLKIDLYQKQQIIIRKDVQSYLNPIFIYCAISDYNKGSDVEFCSERFCPYTDMEKKFKLNFVELSYPLKGKEIEITLPDNEDVSDTFFCRATDGVNRLSIRSSNIQIRDIIYWKQNLIMNSDNIKSTIDYVVDRSRLPLTLSCMKQGLTFNMYKPLWYEKEFPHPVSWAVCPVKKDYEKSMTGERISFHDCVKYTTSKWDKGYPKLEPYDIKDKSHFSSYIDKDGNLIIFDIDSQQVNTDHTYAFMCYIKKSNTAIPINTYIKEGIQQDIKSGLVFNVSVDKTEYLLKPISPLMQNFTICEGKVQKNEEKIDPISIFAKYTASKDVQYKWYHKNMVLHNMRDVTLTRYQVLFSEDIKPVSEGKYVLSLEDKNNQKLNMTMMVTVLSQPTLIDEFCLMQVQYIWEYNEFTFSCKYSGSEIDLTLQINDFYIKEDYNVEDTKKNLGSKYAHLSEMSFSYFFTSDRETKSKTLQYSLYNLTISQGQNIYQDHAITFLAQNKFGLISSSSSIYVVPDVELQITIFPNSMNCIHPCKSSETHKFSCRFNAEKYKSKGLIVDHYWSVNSQRLDQNKSDNIYFNYFKMDPETKDLELMTINSSNTALDNRVKKALRSNYIECNIDLKSLDQSISKFEYVSKNDKKLRDKLRAKIELDYVVLNTAYISLIVIAILICIIVIILAVVYRNRTNEGDTYFLEKLEYKHGINREQEREEEVIQPYTNLHEQRNSGSIHSDDGIHDSPLLTPEVGK